MKRRNALEAQEGPNSIPDEPQPWPDVETWQKWLLGALNEKFGPLRDPQIRALWVEYGFFHPDGYVTDLALAYFQSVVDRGGKPFMPVPGATVMRLYQDGYHLTNQGWAKS